MEATEFNYETKIITNSYNIGYTDIMLKKSNLKKMRALENVLQINQGVKSAGILKLCSLNVS